MQSFPVICETCHSRLRVRDPDAVGQIHACPKCDSMVHVVPPPGWADRSVDPPPSPTATDPADLVTSIAPAPADLIASSIDADIHSDPPRQVVDAEPDGLQSPDSFDIDPDGLTEIEPPLTQANSLESVADNGLDLQPETKQGLFQTVHASLWERVTLWSILGGIGVVIAGGLAGWAWVSRSATGPPAVSSEVASVESGAANTEVGATDPQDHPAGSEELKTSASDGSIAGLQNADDAVPLASLPSELSHPPDDLPSGLTTETMGPGEDNQSDVEQASDTTPEVEKPQKIIEEDDGSPALARPATDASQPTAVVEEIDLLSFDPAFLDLAVGISRGSGSHPDRSFARDVSQGQQPIAEFEPIEDPSAPTPPPASKSAELDVRDAKGDETLITARMPADHPVDSADVPNHLFDVRSPVRRGPTPDTGRAAPDAATQLKIPVARMLHAEVMFIDWLRLMSDLTAVPITVDPMALALAGVSPHDSISVDATDTTAGELLEKVLANHRLELEIRHGHLMVAREERHRRRSVNYGVKDLLPAGASDASYIADLIQTVVAPETWKPAGGEGVLHVQGQTIRIEHQQRVHLQTLVLLERMLLARDLPTKTRYPRQLLSVDSSYALLKPKLEARVTYTFLPWSRLADVFRHWEQSSPMNVLVDWSALADVQLSPDSLVACSANDLTWREALGKTLQPLELGYRAINADTIQITSLAALGAERFVEFYPVADLVRQTPAGADSLIDRLKAALPEELIVNCRFVLDAPSGYLIVLGPGPAQQALADRLAQM